MHLERKVCMQKKKRFGSSVLAMRGHKVKQQGLQQQDSPWHQQSAQQTNRLFISAQLLFTLYQRSGPTLLKRAAHLQCVIADWKETKTEAG